MKKGQSRKPVTQDTQHEEKQNNICWTSYANKHKYEQINLSASCRTEVICTNCPMYY